jgi:hypothetical protein
MPGSGLKKKTKRLSVRFLYVFFIGYRLFGIVHESLTGTACKNKTDEAQPRPNMSSIFKKRIEKDEEKGILNTEHRISNFESKPQRGDIISIACSYDLKGI